MTRLSVTLDDGVVEDLERLRKRASKERESLISPLQEMSSESQVQLIDQLRSALEDLPKKLSTASLIRNALGFYLNVLKTIEKMKSVEAGYIALSAETERERVLKTQTRKAAKQWAHEE